MTEQHASALPERSSTDGHSPNGDGVLATAELLRLSGVLTLGTDPPPDAVESCLRTLAQSLEGADAVQREAVRAQAVRVLKPHGWRAKAIDALLVPATKPNGANGARPLQGRILVLSTPELWPDPVNGARLLGELTRTYARYVALPEGGATLAALWTLHAHAHDAAQVSPLLGITSATKRCGKTTLLTLLGALVPRPLAASNITAAALFRAVEAFRPTLLVDEADTFLIEHEELRGIVNSGHSRASAQVIRTVGDDHETRVFGTWSPKVVAMIGDLPGTLKDRAAVLRLRRRRKDEKVERLRLDRLSDFEPLRRRCARWAVDHAAALAAADPDVPAELNDRAADNWRALLAIADVVGGVWPERARKAARVLSGGEVDEDEAGVMLLADLQQLFQQHGSDRLASTDVVAALVKMEDRPWPEWRHGQPLTTRQLARLLRPFGVSPVPYRAGDKGGVRGYQRTDLADAWSRYPVSDAGSNTPPADRNICNIVDAQQLSVLDAKNPCATPLHACNDNELQHRSSENVADRQMGDSPTLPTDVADVGDRAPEIGAFSHDVTGPPADLWGDGDDYDRLEREAIQHEGEA